MEKVKVYIDSETGDIMVFDHTNNYACWGEKFYRCPFSAIKKYWTLLGDF